MDCYATLFLSWVIHTDAYLKILLQKKLKPEIGLQHGSSGFSLNRHRQMASVIKERGLGCAIHLPFYDIFPGHREAKTRLHSRDLMLKALEIAALYEPDHLIGHPEFLTYTDSKAAVGDRPSDDHDSPENQPSDDWLKYSYDFWSEVLEMSPARLFLENTSDQSPTALATLLETLPERAAMCFDVGHWYYAANGRDKQNLDWWMDILSPHCDHLHLHDNDGDSDQHLGMGQGGVDYEEVMAQLKRRGLRPTFTLEAHRKDSLNQSMAWLSAYPDVETVLDL